MCVAVVFWSRYSIDRNTDLERFFNVDALSGVISTAKLLDREANSVHNLTVFAIESREFTPDTHPQMCSTCLMARWLPPATLIVDVTDWFGYLFYSQQKLSDDAVEILFFVKSGRPQLCEVKVKLKDPNQTAEARRATCQKLYRSLDPICPRTLSTLDSENINSHAGQSFWPPRVPEPCGRDAD